jgi:6-phosphogluconolactonase
MLALSGGNTPRFYLPMLGARFQRWDVVDVRLIDDRWVRSHHADSNEGMLRQLLPQARLSGLVNDAEGPLAGLAEASASMAACPEPWDIALLGMGGDGHIASLFPGTGTIEDPAPYCVAVPEAPLHPRISLSAAALLRFQHLLLILTGEDKLDALARAERDALPVRLLTQASERLEIFWSP